MALPSLDRLGQSGNMRDDIVVDRLPWRVACPNHASIRLLTVARKGSCEPTSKMILLRTQLLALCSKQEGSEKSPQAPGLKSVDTFLRVIKLSPCLTAIEQDENDM